MIRPLRKISRRGASSVEYVLITALVIIPLALLVPMLTRMVTTWGLRIFWIFKGPFP